MVSGSDLCFKNLHKLFYTPFKYPQALLYILSPPKLKECLQYSLLYTSHTFTFCVVSYMYAYVFMLFSLI